MRRRARRSRLHLAPSPPPPFPEIWFLSAQIRRKSHKFGEGAGERVGCEAGTPIAFLACEERPDAVLRASDDGHSPAHDDRTLQQLAMLDQHVDDLLR